MRILAMNNLWINIKIMTMNFYISIFAWNILIDSPDYYCYHYQGVPSAWIPLILSCHLFLSVITLG